MPRDHTRRDRPHPHPTDGRTGGPPFAPPRWARHWDTHPAERRPGIAGLPWASTLALAAFVLVGSRLAEG
ncbi:hypothetical protein ACWGIG_35175, partial [Streptomyces sp. NPDC054863]